MPSSRPVMLPSRSSSAPETLARARACTLGRDVACFFEIVCLLNLACERGDQLTAKQHAFDGRAKLLVAVLQVLARVFGEGGELDVIRGFAHDAVVKG